MTDRIIWKPALLTTPLGRRTVYVKYYLTPFYGLSAAADTWFSIPAFIRVRGRRVHGYITPRDGMAYCQEHGESEFRPYKI